MFAIKALKKGDIVARDEVDRSVCNMDSINQLFSFCMQHNCEPYQTVVKFSERAEQAVISLLGCCRCAVLLRQGGSSVAQC